MSKISATIVADSICPRGHRITSMLVTFPRFILAELNTHRMLSKNSASSRAIPFNKMFKSVQENPFIPIAWQKEHKGMQGTNYEFEEKHISEIRKRWLMARDEAIELANQLNYDFEVTKQLCNRLIEPFMWHTVLITATEWENFFALRSPQYEFNNKIFRSKKDALVEIEKVLGESDFNNTDDYLQWAAINKGQAEIHMMALAECMWDAMNESTPKQLKISEWHIVFGDKFDINRIKMNCASKDTNKNESTDINWILKRKIEISTGMAARASYTVVGNEKEVSYETLMNIHDKMAVAIPWHASPFEHNAQIPTNEEYNSAVKGEVRWLDFGKETSDNKAVINKNSLGWFRNFHGFKQYRQILEENQVIS